MPHVAPATAARGRANVLASSLRTTSGGTSATGRAPESAASARSESRNASSGSESDAAAVVGSGIGVAGFRGMGGRTDELSGPQHRGGGSGADGPTATGVTGAGAGRAHAAKLIVRTRASFFRRSDPPVGGAIWPNRRETVKILGVPIWQRDLPPSPAGNSLLTRRPRRGA